MNGMIFAEEFDTKYGHMTYGISLRKLFMLSGFIALVSLTSCDPTLKTDDLEAKEKLDISNFILNNDTIDFVKKSSGLYYYDLVAGTGANAEAQDSAYIFYAMQYLTTQIFETNIGTTDTLKVLVNDEKLLLGIKEGLSYMNEGGKSLLVVPSSLAFGSQGSYYVSPYTPFLFQIYLVRLKKH
jgi:FKBP-type peptidyl-prolyl cis-trans isomerase FkpA